jgi:hypothetical protein
MFFTVCSIKARNNDLKTCVAYRRWGRADSVPGRRAGGLCGCLSRQLRQAFNNYAFSISTVQFFGGLYWSSVLDVFIYSHLILNFLLYMIETVLLWIQKIWNKYSQKKGLHAQPQFQFPHLCVCERFIYSHYWSAYSAAGKYVDRSWEYMYTVNHSQTHECGNWEIRPRNSQKRKT